MPLDRERVRQLLDVFNVSGAGEFALQEGDRYYRFVRAVAAPVATPEAGAPAVVAVVEPDPAAHDVTVSARVVGLFYRGKQPGQDPLVELGDTVAEGDQLGIIEVLRTPTVISSTAAGEIVEIAHEDGHGVQYGDPLFVIRPA